MKNEWTSINDKSPDEGKVCIVKTDCENCPILSVCFCAGKFKYGVFIQCDEHYPEKPDFHFFKFDGSEAEFESHRKRITHWIQIPEDTDER